MQDALGARWDGLAAALLATDIPEATLRGRLAMKGVGWSVGGAFLSFGGVLGHVVPHDAPTLGARTPGDPFFRVESPDSVGFVVSDTNTATGISFLLREKEPCSNGDRIRGQENKNDN